jgi:DNA-binding transcriptional LysR family regulator
VLAIRAGSRKAARLKSLDGFLDARHVAVVGPGERQDLVDTWLRTKGYTRRIALTVPTYLLAFGIVAESDLVAVVPKQLIARLGRKLGVRAMPLPLEPGTDEIFLHHPIIADTEPGSAWLRKAIQSLT